MTRQDLKTINLCNETHKRACHDRYYAAAEDALAVLNFSSFTQPIVQSIYEMSTK